MQPNMFAAELVERSASGLAGYASSLLLERNPAINDRFAPDAFAAWKTNLTQRLLELSSALAAGEPKLFSSRVLWLRKMFVARQLEAGDIEASLDALRQVLKNNLPELPASDCIAYIDKATAMLASEQTSLDESELDPARPHDKITLQYLQKVLEGNIADAIDLVVNSVDDSMRAPSMYVNVLLPAQREIGRLWHLGEVSIAEEHLVSFATQRAMAILANTPGARQPSNGKTVVAAAVAGNAHDIGLRAVADLYQLDGWRSIFLGSDVPARDLSATLTFFEADVLLLAATLTTQLPKVAESVQLIRDRCDRDIKVILGGAAFDEAPQLWQRMGGDGYAGAADDAVALGTRLVA